MHSNYRVSGSKAYYTPISFLPVVLRSEEEEGGEGVCQLNVHMLSRERESLAWEIYFINVDLNFYWYVQW